MRAARSAAADVVSLVVIIIRSFFRSDDMLGLERTLFIVTFDPQRRLVDLETVTQVTSDRHDKRVRRLPRSHHEMTSQRCVRRCSWPRCANRGCFLLPEGPE